MILERDEQGFFETVITAHPLARQDRTIHLNDRHRIYEFSLGNCFYPSGWNWLLLPLLPFKVFSMIFRLLAVIRAEKIQVIRATDPYLMGLIAWMLGGLARIPFCVSIHIDYEKSFILNPQRGVKKILRKYSRWAPEFVFKRADLVMPIRTNYKLQIPKSIKDEKIKVIPHGIPFDFQVHEDLRKKWKIPADKKIISFVGRLSQENFIVDMLSMVERLSVLRDDFLLVIMGGGEMEAEMKLWLARRPTIAHHILMLGFQPNAMGRSLRHISQLNLCLFGGFSLLEACAAARPIVAYDVDWHDELVKNHMTGFLVKEHDVNGVVAAVQYLLDHPEEATQMGERARDLAREYHDVLKTTKIKQDCYQRLLTQNSI